MKRHATMAMGMLSVWVACIVTPEAWGQESSGVEVRIGAVVASNAGQAFDQRLASLRRQFNSLFPYTSYRLIKEERRTVLWGRKAGFDLPGGHYLLVIPRGCKDNRVSMKLILVEGSRPLFDTVVGLRNQGTFLVGGPRHQEGRLIIAIAAETNAAPK
ncbi:MAG: hypothetical protein A3J75_00485 [Acidobacteria bacterium RBG_16_68_9]|nr:MAG: hypothetical protein A3J75_00485 [Acidobacteria bacterium RBG_16_68_9]